MIHRLRLSCAAVVVLCASVHAADFELNGHALGDRNDAVLADERFDCSGVSACFLFTACSLRATHVERLHGAPLDALTLYYVGERIAAMEARFDPVHFDAVLRATAAQHGAPQTEST